MWRLALVLAGCVAGARAAAAAPRMRAPHARAAHRRTAAIRLAEDDGVTIRVRTPAEPAAAAPAAASAEVEVTIRPPSAPAAGAAAGAGGAVVTVRPPPPAASDAPPPEAPSTPDGLLIEASRTGAIRGIRAALAAGADANACDSQGFSALHLCAATGLAPGVVVLAGAGAALDYRAQNLTPLTIAIGYSKPFTVETLVRCGADVSGPDADGTTPSAFVSSLIATELEQDAGKKEGVFTRVVNKRLQALRKMDAALALTAGRPALPAEEARGNVEAMLAELGQMLGW